VHDNVLEGQNSDVWSLGCIYSEAARWLKDGHRGVQAYRQERQAETSKIQGFRDGDCFHDGEKILNCVRQCHKNSVRNLRPEDFITKPVVDTLIGDMMGKAQARSTAFRLYQKSRQLVSDAKFDLESARAEPEPSNLPMFHGRPRNRSLTVPTYDSRPPPPPKLPPGYSPMTGSHADHPSKEIFALPDKTSPPRILDPIGVTSEPDGTESLQLSPTSLPTSNSPGENSYQKSPPGIPAITHDEPEDIDPFSNVKYGKRPDSGVTWHAAAQEAPSFGPVASEPKYSPPISNVAPYESPSPPHPPHTVPMSPSSYNSQPGATPGSSPPQRSSSTRRNVAHGVLRPKPVVIQHPKLPHLSLEDALLWRRSRKGNGQKIALKDAQYLDRLKERDHVSYP